MTRIGTAQRVFFAAVGLFALWVGAWGYLAPTKIDQAIPWLVPPLHARFLGSMYLSGAALMLGGILCHRWAQARIINTMIYLWTGMLFVVSLFYLSEFDVTRTQVWFWWFAYLVYPLIAAYWAWKLRHEPADASSALPRWAVAYLWLQGGLVIVLALALLLFPRAMLPLWPWKISPLLAQIYSSPFLAYGIGSVLIARRPRWSEAVAPMAGIWVFAAAVLLASWLHRGLFSSTENPDRLWFAGFGVATLVLGVLSIRGFLETRRA
jgi:hypothetical protein